MDRGTLESFAFIVAIVIAVIASWLIGNITVASVIGGALIVRLIQIFVFGKRDREASRATYRASKLSEPLQRIFRNLGEDPRYSSGAVGVFKSEILDIGLSQVLKTTSSQLFDDLNSLRGLVQKLSSQPYTEDDVRKSMGHLYQPSTAAASDLVKLSYVLAERLGQSGENQELIIKIRKEIEAVLAKFGA